MKKLILFFLGSLLLTVAPLASHAKDGDIIKRGQCSTGTNTKLKASPENGQIEVEYELGDAVPGDLWRITITKNGKSILRTSQRVNAAGDIEVRKITPNTAGSDTIRATAKKAGAAGACTISLSVPF